MEERLTLLVFAWELSEMRSRGSAMRSRKACRLRELAGAKSVIR